MKMPIQDRRQFLGSTAVAMAALVASGCSVRGPAGTGSPRVAGYGDLVADPAGFIDLPQGFSYRILSKLGDRMDDGGSVPDAADGMGCFDIGGGKLVLVRNHELMPGQDIGDPLPKGFGKRDGLVLPGGTTNIVLDARTLAVEKQFRSLAGTIRNCAGGTTPWGSWLTCEEAVTGPGQRYGEGLDKNHGWIFEVPATATGLVDAVPLKAMGRFNHEAACVDPRNGLIYLTEDRDDSLLYRFVPNSGKRLAEGGQLQAMRIVGLDDTRNWDGSNMPREREYAVEWVVMDDVEAPKDDLRQRGAAKGCARFARGEGIHMGDGELYFACTSGGAAKLGQIFRLRPAFDGSRETVSLFYESTDPDQFNYGDNLTIAPDGQLVVCEDQYTEVVDNHLRGVTRDGRAYPLARLRRQTEWAGACFSPDGRVLFVNSYSPAATLAITGPWQHLG